MIRTTFSSKGRAKRFRGAGRRVYKVKSGWRVSPGCPRRDAKRRALMKHRTKTRARPHAGSAWFKAVRVAQVPF